MSSAVTSEVSKVSDRRRKHKLSGVDDVGGDGDIVTCSVESHVSYRQANQETDDNSVELRRGRDSVHTYRDKQTFKFKRNLRSNGSVELRQNFIYYYMPIEYMKLNKQSRRQEMGEMMFKRKLRSMQGSVELEKNFVYYYKPIEYMKLNKQRQEMEKNEIISTEKSEELTDGQKLTLRNEIDKILMAMVIQARSLVKSSFKRKR